MYIHLNNATAVFYLFILNKGGSTMKRAKSLIYACLVLTLIFLPSFVVWCGGEKEAPEEAEEEGVVTLTLWKFGSPQHEREYMIEKIKVFEEQKVIKQR